LIFYNKPFNPVHLTHHFNMPRDETSGNTQKRRKISDNVYCVENYTENDDHRNVDTEEIASIENIVECRESDGVTEYQIKWTGSEMLTWITEENFIEKDALEEFKQYERLRNNSSIVNKGYIYCRTSKKSGNNGVSLYVQEQQCLDFAKKNNIHIVGCYRDDGVRASNIKKRHGLSYIMNKIQKGDILIFYDISRFSRHKDSAIELLEDLRNNVGVTVYSVFDNCVWDDNESNRSNFEKILDNSQYYSDMTSKKIKNAIKFKRDRGDYTGGYVTYGYKVDFTDSLVKKLIKNNDEILVIRKLFEIGISIVKDNPNTYGIAENEILCIFSDILDDFDDEYKIIAHEINKYYSYRNNKKFTVKNIKYIMNKLKNDIFSN
jgi:DNA invertase Pin-like site-specific DNA recombinase